LYNTCCLLRFGSLSDQEGGSSLKNSVSLDGENNLLDENRDQILMRVFTTVLNHCMKSEAKGWVAVDEALWSRNTSFI
jgi:hypothetical protein